MKNDGFTLLEALISLLIAALVLTSLQFVVPFLKQISDAPKATVLQTITHQLETQKYTITSATLTSARLKSYEGKDMYLEVKNNKLQISGSGAGQIILMQNVTNLAVDDRNNYLNLTITTNKGKFSSILHLKKTVQNE
ncbi:competence protein ComGF [Leuconostoc mesenteroides subsp. dextranicum]|jgi:competence protein ComGF|uniref:Competence protein ComGF n=4 Tax=Leuconostoc mesenteroides TaxID=1245 RepID=A0A843YZL8_LEUME|nr:prepilin-type N-terminal cleavage/methylation domain-containing protein [Leuconostoc mesenteroides]ABJ61582.1 Competence protein ComGF [Leuconostoc mesenteroides subsp. mesenteroides ATCC 8293]ARN62950.1 competence protein ComGF [Leuconostoc mesenteroides subsp. mesenteroides]KMY78626.1 competence protein ComGF [Leuconostoc mesenteroides subsp. mesenteroides]KMY81198.1 competence protein ComGF [Leuconostoc mesenteroides subsp. dextranicum]MBZ1502116.1 prepilin-type N-terminal cleavage/methy